MVKHIQTICQLLLTNCWVCLTILWGWCLSSCHMRSALLLGLEISNFRVTKQRFYTKQGQKTYFKNGFHKERVILSSNFQSFQTNPFHRLFICATSPRQKNTLQVLIITGKKTKLSQRLSSPSTRMEMTHFPSPWSWFFFLKTCAHSQRIAGGGWGIMKVP